VRPGRVTNALSVDLEGFVESNQESFPIPAGYHDPVRESREIERNTEVTLDLFERRRVRATFFVVGRIARDLPGVVRSIAAAGHEVGCHNYEHRRVFGLTPAAFREGMRRALADLQDVSGQPVRGFRAPDFSITRRSLWALDVLRELGFAYDSSIYPIRGHDVYGIGDLDPWIHRLPNGLVEFPLSSVALGRRRLPFGGGGYFRLYPLPLTHLLVRLTNRAGRPFMLYIHPYEVGPEIPRIAGLPRLRRFRHYYNTRNGAARLGDLLGSYRFAPVRDVLEENGFAE
jgi:polysaccharide deacetylase family protein (PEP-CTERM system associated)